MLLHFQIRVPQVGLGSNIWPNSYFLTPVKIQGRWEKCTSESILVHDLGSNDWYTFDEASIGTVESRWPKGQQKKTMTSRLSSGDLSKFFNLNLKHIGRYCTVVSGIFVNFACATHNITLQVWAVLLAICQWTQSVTESFTIHHGCRGMMQVTSVCLVVGRWLFSLTLDVRQTTDNLLTG